MLKKGMLKKSLVVLGLLVCVGCAGTQPSAKEDVQIEQIKWDLVSFGLSKMAVPQKVWIRFEKGTYQGFSGCNGMGGKYELSSETMTLHAGMATLMACEQMALETKYQQALSKVSSYERQGNRLVLKHDDAAVLIFMHHE